MIVGRQRRRPGNLTAGRELIQFLLGLLRDGRAGRFLDRGAIRNVSSVDICQLGRFRMIPGNPRHKPILVVAWLGIASIKSSHN
jgi:hypothetical protein